MMILLTDEEIGKAVSDWVDVASSARSVGLGRGHWEDIAPVIALAQAKKMVEWGEGNCPHINAYENKPPFALYPIRIHLCPHCWQALKQALKAEVKDD